MKSGIIERLGESGILLPALIADGLAANDRVKVRLSLLQAAARHAREPNGRPFDLAGECRAVGLDAVAMEALVHRAASLRGERIAAAGLGDLEGAIADDVAVMIRAVKAADAEEGDKAAARLAAITEALSLGSSDTVEFAQIAGLTSVAGDGKASLHRLIMDLHKALNRLSAAHAEEVVAGAHVYGLLPEDRPAIEAFMRGVESTRALKFDHPGLATTAARAGNRLTIQNDIGETDAHVVIVTVEPEAVTVTYTDVHLPRAKFFTGLFRSYAVEWSGLDRQNAEGLGKDGVFYLVTGRYPAAAGKHEAFLEKIGASLVFLIDWNKARKVLQAWISNRDAIQVLDWAARHRFGHRAFLALGGSELVAAAVRHAAPTRIGFGERLDHALGREAAVDFLKSVLRVSAEALLQGNVARLARDRIEADLVRHLQRVEAALLAIVIRQAGLAREIAADIAGFVAEQEARRPFDRAALARRARHVEEKADRIAIEAHTTIEQLSADHGIERLVARAEEAIDELEQAAFIVSLANELPRELLPPLAQLCAAAIAGAEAAASGVAAAIEVPEGHRIDADAAFAAVGRLIDAEHAADAAERALTTKVLGGNLDLKTALAALELARALERATDRLAAFGHLLRRYLLAGHSN